MEKSVIIVGAGIAGLSAGCYARMNGYKTDMYEMHKIPGGLCTAWRKKGYTFDISMHMLTGSVSGPFHRMWEELGVAEKFHFHFHDLVTQVEGMGNELKIQVDRKRLEQELTAISPEDKKLIREFTRIIYGPDLMKASSLNPARLTSILEKIKALPAILPMMPFFMKYGKMSIQQFVDRFKNPFLRQAVRFIVDTPGWPMPDFPILAMIGFMRGGVTEAGVPLGGSQKVVFHIADLYKNMGGRIHYNARVTGLILENNRVAGIRLWDGTEHRADHVIWAGDGHTLHFDVLGGKYLNDRIREMYEKWKPVKPIVHVMIGVNKDFSKEPHRLVLEMDEPITIAGHVHDWMAVNHHSFDPSMAPEGKSVVEVWIDTEYEYWEQLSHNREDYEAEKKRIADHMIRQLEKRWPGFTSLIEVIDVPTPATYKRYTGNWKGSPDGWYITTDNIRSMEPMRDIPGLEGLYMAGQWTSPFTGTIIAALSGRQIIQIICWKDKKKFSTSRPLNLQKPAEGKKIEAVP